MEQTDDQIMEVDAEKATQVLVILYEHEVGNIEARDKLTRSQISMLERKYLRKAYLVFPVYRTREIGTKFFQNRADDREVGAYQMMKYQERLTAIGRREQKWTPEYLIEMKLP